MYINCSTYHSLSLPILAFYFDRCPLIYYSREREGHSNWPWFLYDWVLLFFWLYDPTASAAQRLALNCVWLSTKENNNICIFSSSVAPFLGFLRRDQGDFVFFLRPVPCDSAATVVRSCVGFHCSYGVSWLLRVLWNCCGVLLLLFTTAELLLRAVTYSSDDDDFRLFCVGKIPWLAAAATTTHWYFSRNYYYSRRSLEVAGVDFSFFLLWRFLVGH